MSHNRLYVALCATACLIAPVKAATNEPSTSSTTAGQILRIHNEARADKLLPTLQWNADLAKAAEGWAKRLANEGRLRHSSWDEREGTGENLWMGTSGYYGPDSMIRAFIDERRDFRPGVFPKVSKTGRWSDVGHYTQIIWPSTQQVGCAVAKGKRMDVLVCRYWPAGNMAGSKVG